MEKIFEKEQEVDVIFDKDLMFRLNNRNENSIIFGNDELKNDKELVLEAVKSNGFLIHDVRT